MTKSYTVRDFLSRILYPWLNEMRHLPNSYYPTSLEVPADETYVVPEGKELIVSDLYVEGTLYVEGSVLVM